VDKRHRIPFRYRQTGSPFEYELLRMLYTMKRDYDVDN
jgi:phospholipid-binding lipoprotein MlaA